MLIIEVTAKETEKTAAANDQHEALAARLLPTADRLSTHNGPGYPLWHETRFGNAASGTHGEWFLSPGRPRAQRVQLDNLPLAMAERVLAELAKTDRGPVRDYPRDFEYEGEAARRLAGAVPGLVPADSAPAPGTGVEDWPEQRFTCELDPLWCPEAVVTVSLDGPGPDARVSIRAASLTGLEAMVVLLAYSAAVPPRS